MAEPLFSQVTFHIVLSDGLSEEEAQTLATTLQENGATQINPPSMNGTFDVEPLTHIICASIDFESYDEAVETMKSVVKPDWVTSTMKKGKLANPRSHSPDPKMIFSGLIVHVADLPDLDKNAIIAGLEVLGGIYASAITRQVTHIVALDMKPPACQMAVDRGLAVKIVLPHWFDDCFRLGRRIYEGPYTLPNPSYLEAEGEISHRREAIKLIGMPSSLDNSQLTPPNSPICKRILKDHKFMLSSDLNIKGHLVDTLSSIIINGGGTVVDEVSEADIYIGQYRDGQDFVAAGRANITIGNLPWLYHLISTDRWSSPLQRLLHYPIPRTGIAGFENYCLSLSNYNGDARLFLENLARAAGCEFTKSFKANNTHLITAHTKSEKCDAAREWNVHIVNHLWLEDSYAKNSIQTVSNPRYTHFPPKTNLGAVVGQTRIDKSTLEKYFLPPPKSPEQVDEAKENTKEEAEVKAFLNPDIAKAVKSVRSESVEATPAIPKSSPALSHRTKDTNATPLSSSKNRSIVTPAPGSAGKENETPPTGGRGSKLKAMAMLSTQAEDIALYEKEKKRKGGVTHGGRSSEDRVAVAGTKRAISTTTDTDQETRKKKIKPTLPKPEMTLLVTGYPEWASNTKAREKHLGQLRKLGIVLTEEPVGCQYLAAPKILRTRKFICAIPSAPTIISTNFVSDCLEQQKLLNPADYSLKDTQGEKTYHTTLKDAISRAKENQGQLLKGQTIYVTKGVRGGAETYRDIAISNGGRCVDFVGRKGSLVENEENSNPRTYIYLISGHDSADQILWPKFREQAKAKGLEPRIVKSDWLLDLALAQKERWHQTYLIEGD